MQTVNSPSSGDPKPVVAFLYFDHLHQVFHTASIAFELARRGADVRLFTSSRESFDLLKRVAQRYPESDARIELLEASLWHRLLTWLKGRRPYPRAKFILQRHARRLLDADAVVSPDFYSLHLFDHRSGARPLFVRVFHGAGDRDYGVDERLQRYDLVLLHGRKFARRVDAMGVPESTVVSIIGYPKFDVCGPEPTDDGRIFDEARPTVVYAPHFERGVSSWHAWGLDVLEWFYASGRYNLIFAPHIMLFAKKDPRRVIPSRYFDAPHIHIDPGSLASVDMTYTNAADIYLGDVSSQVYEFVATRPRPCVFLNPHGVAWEDDSHFLFWTLGTVVTTLDDFEQVFRAPPSLSETDRETQRRLVAEAFDHDPAAPPGVRGAEAILACLDRR